jgi:hypothetical protein
MNPKQFCEAMIADMSEIFQKELKYVPTGKYTAELIEFPKTQGWQAEVVFHDYPEFLVHIECEKQPGRAGIGRTIRKFILTEVIPMPARHRDEPDDASERSRIYENLSALLRGLADAITVRKLSDFYERRQCDELAKQEAEWSAAEKRYTEDRRLRRGA